MKNKNEFKKGDKLYHVVRGWLVYDGISGSGIHVTNFNHYSFILSTSNKELLSYTEYTLKGFSQERPEQEIKRNTFVYYKLISSSECWSFGFYSGLSNINTHRVFSYQKKYENNIGIISVFAVSLTNPLT